MSEILKNFDRFLIKLEKVAEKSLEDFEKSVKQEIIDRTPMDTGALRASYSFGRVDSSDMTVEYKFSFGANLTNEEGQPYAAVVHSWYDPNVNWTTAGTGPGFLIEPVASYQDSLKIIYSLNLKRILL